MIDKLFEIKNLQCSYDIPFIAGKSKVVLSIKDLTLPRGKKVFIVGESGIGKSTILEVLGMMNNTIVPNPETVFRFHEKEGRTVDLADLWKQGSDKALSDFRLRHFSFIFQSTNLMRNFTALENIAVTRMLQGYPVEESFRKASRLLEDLGLHQIENERMAQDLSGGQQQRLAFARAILPDFSVLFGDEPTGNLDEENAVKVMGILSDKMESLEGSSAIIVSHDMSLAITFADIIIKIRKELFRTGNGESSTYGVIDPDCCFHSEGTGEGRIWTNGKVSHSDASFERFLKNIKYESA